MPRSVRFAIFVLYGLGAIAVPLLLALFPGQPPLAPEEALLEVADGRFVTPEKALGEGAESYQYDVVNDLEGRLAGAAATYPDGSSALIARFESERAALAAAERLMELIPHKAAMTDLWATRFQSDSGEFVAIATVGPLLALIIADTEELAARRLESLPALRYEPDPGFGAVLARNDLFGWIAWIGGYVLFQMVTLSRLASWVARRDPPPGVEALEPGALRQRIEALGEGDGPFHLFKLPSGDLMLTWREAAGARSGRAEGVRLELDPRRKVVRALPMEAPLDGPLDGEKALAALPWRPLRYVPLKVVEAPPPGSRQGLFEVAAAVVVEAGWRFRPVLSPSHFVSG